MNKRRCLLWLIDGTILLASYLSTAILFQSNIASMGIYGEFTPGKFALILALGFGMRNLLGIYRVLWRYANVSTYLRLVAADLLAGMSFVLLGRMVSQWNLGFASSLILYMIALILTLCSRFVYQVNYARLGRREDGTGAGNKIQIAIVGAGNVGASLAEELTRNPKSHYIPIGFFDIDQAKAGKAINGVPVYQENENTVEFIRRQLPVQEIVIAIPDADQKEKMRLYERYRQTGCKIKIYDYPLHEKETEQGKRGLREFQIEDLLFRDAVKVRSARAREFYRDKTILVTGGGGSIGSELCRQIARRGPGKLVILDIYENSAYEIQQELGRKYGGKLNLEVYIASVRDRQRLEQIFRKERPQLVFHAAAHKHVPLMEVSGCEAIKNNTLGTYNVADMAEKYDVEKFLLISTDKAVNPTNIMGASKRLCEMVIQCRRDSKTEFTAVRFGNVLGSNGSVIPLFKQQIAAGGPITLTDKRIIRYFMTIPEAVGLVMETCCMAKNGELYVLDMGKPVKILDLAESMIQLSGLVPYQDIDIVEIGLRPGEKLYEELLMKTKELDKTENELIFIERDQPLSREAVEEKLDILRRTLEEEGDILAAVQATVPTFRSPEEVNRAAAMAEEMKNARQLPVGV